MTETHMIRYKQPSTALWSFTSVYAAAEDRQARGERGDVFLVTTY